jgi:NADPH-dependent curcumin reductase CurA
VGYLSREVRLVSRPRGLPRPHDFAVVEVDVPDPAAGQLVVEAAYVSLDPFLRQGMSGSDRPPYPLNATPPAFMVGRVVASRHPAHPEGRWVVGRLGWRAHAISDGHGLTRFDPASAAVPAALGVLGMPGFTAWCGVEHVAPPEPGQTMYVSAAAGAVGSLVGQLARARGARVIGSAGTREKVGWIRTLGFAEVFDYRRTPVREALASFAPDGLDLYFDNVGGDQLEAAIGAMRDFGRVVSCGGIASYNAAEPPPGPRNLNLLFMRSLTVRGFRNYDFIDDFPRFTTEMGALVRDGAVRYRERVVNGLDAIPDAYAEVFDSTLIGKVVARVGDP